MKLIDSLKSRFKRHKEKKFLDAHGCATWEQYERKHDPDISYLARTAKSFYHGYPYVYEVSSYDLVKFVDNIPEVLTWCTSNCTDKWRYDWIRGTDMSDGEFELCEVGGYDKLFFAFKTQADYTWFVLVWS